MMKRNRTGDVLSPCCTPVLYSMIYMIALPLSCCLHHATPRNAAERAQNVKIWVLAACARYTVILCHDMAHVSCHHRPSRNIQKIDIQRRRELCMSPHYDLHLLLVIPIIADVWLK
jgi:hypothetical protein